MTDNSKVLELIDKQEIAELVIALGNIDTPPNHEKPMGDFVEAWLKREGFKTKVVGLFPERPNVIGTLEGTGEGYSLLFNSHMDTGPSANDVWLRRDPLARICHSVWREGNLLRGYSAVNDKGPMACFLIAAKAIKKAGVALKGDLIVTAVSGEIEQQPVDEFHAPEWVSHEVGSRFIVTHGVIADYALVAEATDFRLTWLEAGRAIFKITVFGRSPAYYAPYLKAPYARKEHPNAIFRAAELLGKLEEWMLEYEQKHRYEGESGTLIPKPNLGAIRGGAPYMTAMTPELCSLYLDLRIEPGHDILKTKGELKGILKSLELDGEVELHTSFPGYEAKNIDRLAGSISQAHGQIFGDKPKPVIGPECSMWRDTNVFNEVGIPSATYGPAAGAGGGAWNVKIDDLLTAAKVYALTALDLCNQEKK